MENRSLADVVADAVGGLTAEATLAVALAFAYLGITISQDKARPSINVRVEGSLKASEAEFDVSSKVWQVAGESPRNISNGGLDERLSLEESQAEDWTLELPDTEHNRFLRTRDWASTALGPIQSWKEPLRLMAQKVRRVSISDGPLIKKHRCLQILKHPACIGM